ncbi:hypothetical protein DM02DRAFT_691345 [Periconia macrospinosa]|uniref:Uncharacterized protein n=1 Tax=Periconia macrospinosa TaxID=97972 RepID=A0A2V1DAK7_9PLEO|nr:hypothetical protein DM02DRAFT_691345 [Periconia macrospinosa]
MRSWEGCDVVWCGFWINWSSDNVHGAVLTLPRQWALILVAFMALFVKLAGSYLWGIICFAIHQANASSWHQDDMYHHFQLVLRNSESEASFIGKLLTVGVAHKGARLEAYKRSMWLIILAALHGMSMWVADTLSSRFIVSGDEVQAVPSKCGWMRDDGASVDALADEATFENLNSLAVMTRHGYRRSAAYSRSCYAQMGINTTMCSIYKQTTLPLSIRYPAPCPFNENICYGSAISLDTGRIRSDEHLGINTRPEDAISLRKVLTCVPFAGERYSNASLHPQKNQADTCYYFGQKVGSEVPETICASKVSFSGWYSISSVSAFVSYKGNRATLIEPIPELQSSDSDLTIIDLTNRVAYRKPVDDPWFNARNQSISPTGEDMKVYTATNLMSFIGCQESYQFCTANEDNCSPFTGIYAIDFANLTKLNPTQSAVSRIMWMVGMITQLNFQLIFIGRENLLANDYLWDDSFNFGFSANLPPNQWHKEVVNWMNTSLAAQQGMIYNYARQTLFVTGPSVPTLEYVVEPEDPTMRLLCHKIKHRSQAHTSFNVLSLFLVLGIALIIIALKLSLPTLVSYFQKRTGKGLYKRLEWIETSAFQLQRIAAEGRGIGPWKGREDQVPTLAEHGYLFNMAKPSLRESWSQVGRNGLFEE